MFSSTIIPTVNRPTLSRAVHSVLNQQFDHDDFEVIIVNDSGCPLPSADWQKSPRVQILHTNQRERSVARNAGAAISKGKYLHFLDDDDWMLPDAFKNFWELAKVSQAAWLFGGYSLVDNEGNLIKEFYPEISGNCFIKLVAGEWLPLQTSLIDSEAFFAVGGFASLDSLLGGYEDKDLTKLIGLTYDMAFTPNLVAVIRRGLIGSTTNYTNTQEQLRQSREKILGVPGALGRLLASAKEQSTHVGYWHGKIPWYYLASVKWNLERKQPFIAASRGLSALAGIALGSPYMFSTGFWRGLTKPYYPKAFRDMPSIN